MDEGWRYTLLVNNTDCQLTVDYIGVKYALVPKGNTIIRWKYVRHTDAALPLLKFSTGDIDLNPVFSRHDLYENKRIIIFGDLVNSFSCRMTPRGDRETWTASCETRYLRSQVGDLLRTMVELEKGVRIWHNQCTHLLKKYQEAVERVNRVALEFRDFTETDLESFYIYSQDPTRVRHRYFRTAKLGARLSYALISSMLEGKALLLSCGESFYNQAAFALTSLPPCVPTFSKFALAIRELAWIVEFSCCELEGKPLSLDNWEWCEERCRLVHSDFPNRLDATEDESLEADDRRQNADREALRSSLDLKLSKSPGTSSFKFWNPATWFGWRARSHVQGELESVWRKRLQASSCAPGSYSPLDAFVIDNPDTSFVQVPSSSLRIGTSKSVQKCKWLGETVALSRMSNIPKVFAQAETSLLARVQNPNVVEWMGYAFQEDLRDLDCYRECYLVTEHMECDLHDLITEQLTNSDGTISQTRPPFEFWVAVDIALQIVEAMIHMHRCRVIHRDLKPRNILARRKLSVPSRIWVLPLYTIKLIDFGSSKSGDQGSHFHTRKQGTPIYMAPEVWESESSYSWSADVYSFGLTCFEIVTGRLPFERGMPLTFANVQKVLRGEVSFPSWCPEDLKALIVKCWAQDPSGRPSFDDMRKALWRLKVCPASFRGDWDYSWAFESLLVDITR